MNKTDIYQLRRNALAKHIFAKTGGGIAVISTAPELARNRDSDFPYRHDSDFFYLTGFEEPGATLVMKVSADGSSHTLESHLFCRPKDLEREIWDGIRLGPEAAPKELGIEFAHSIHDLDQKLGELLADQTAIYIRLAENKEADAQLRRWMKQVRAQSRSGINPPSELHDIELLVHEMRLFKDAHELDIMRRAAAISARAHIRAMQICKPGMREYQLEAELLHEFRNSGAQSVAYNSIVAGGANSCILHYRAGSTELRSGELCLIDAGCEFDGYASDITRTFPINGKFTPAQRKIYTLVYEAQEAGIAAVKPGAKFRDFHFAAMRVLAEGLHEMGVLPVSVDDAMKPDSAVYRRWTVHGTGHMLGMDVHDCARARNEAYAEGILEEGMVLTVEPGFYIHPDDMLFPAEYRGIGVRIEDDILVTKDGAKNLSGAMPRHPDEIEAWASALWR